MRGVLKPSCITHTVRRVNGIPSSYINSSDENILMEFTKSVSSYGKEFSFYIDSLNYEVGGELPYVINGR